MPGRRRASRDHESLTSEDRDRTKMYSAERLRRNLSAQSFTDINEYLRSLDMVMSVGVDAVSHIARIAQLTQKTNQFNLTTKRYTDAHIAQFMGDPDCLVAHFSLADIFGDSGVVGVAIVRGLGGGDAVWDSLLMSCRVIGPASRAGFRRTPLGSARRVGR